MYTKNCFKLTVELVIQIYHATATQNNSQPRNANFAAITQGRYRHSSTIRSNSWNKQTLHIVTCQLIVCFIKPWRHPFFELIVFTDQCIRR